ncbi:tetratricopeptide repeat protein [Sphingomonas sp. NBWT7]|uniref:tetratricopeptide repeat protein n=1 Tax=Sphingomonas sp. NBWT7 TaxID=2596913 RepID=UPI00162AB549|nr:tetratricopeptide repeat protein [Sphingomonas sp. NBWT7]QNE32281.1 tetratricopeptide repeat protein [Sphingomonas sp. NBWT7]
MASDPNALFRTAEAQFAAGNHPAALDALDRITRGFGAHAPVLHLTALVHRRMGNNDRARTAFEATLRLAPGNVQARSNYANLLDDMGDAEGALAQLDASIAARPDFADAHINKALILQRIARPAAALAALDRLPANLQASPRVLTIRASLLRDLNRLDEAAATFDAVLAQEPARATALVGRARVALERGEPDAADRYRRGLAGNPDNLELQLGLAQALEADGDEEAIDLLAGALAQRPAWIEGHEQLARMQSEAGRPAAIVTAYQAALHQLPDHLPLHLSYWHTLMRAQRFTEAAAAIAAAPPSVMQTPHAGLIRAMCTSEAGDVSTADRLFAGLTADDEVRIARGRHALRAGRPAEAAQLLETVTAVQPDNVTAWAHLSLAWRLLDHPRTGWLCGQAGLWGTADLPLSSAELDDLAVLLRALHRTRAHPIGQSLRGGTQTRGRLLARQEPPLRHLRDLLHAAVTAHMDALPPADPTHPLLRHRDNAVALAGSWSVRLADSGFHVSHIHPHGVLSSACYIALPDGVANSATHDGWLELGAPPAELGLDLPPLAVVKPQPGRLALFPSYFFHGTRPFAAGERLTVAFDVTVGT